MDAKEAVRLAKTYVEDIFKDEGVGDLRLEEIEHVESEGVWSVTLGFLRRPEFSDPKISASGLMAALDAISARTRVYRVVRIREEDGTVLSVKHRDLSLDAA